MLYFLHGALGSAHQLIPLNEHYPDARIIEFFGHGAQKDLSGQPSIDVYVHQLEVELSAVGKPCAVFGYSMGGYVAIALALRRPELFSSILTLGTKLHWSPAIAAAEVTKLDAEVIAVKVPAFAADLARRHGESRWRVLLADTAQLMQDLGTNPRLTPEILEQLVVPTRLCVGDRDEMVSIEETLAFYRGLQGGLSGKQHQMAVVPGVRHPIEKVPLGTIAKYIDEWCGTP